MVFTGASVIWILLIPFIFSQGNAMKCYYCFETISTVSKNSPGNFSNNDLALQECTKGIESWATIECVNKTPVCTIVAGTVENHYEIVHGCASEGYCTDYVPPEGVKIDFCQECSTSLCNDKPKKPEVPNFPPPVSGPLFNFNINITLNMKGFKP